VLALEWCKPFLSFPFTIKDMLILLVNGGSLAQSVEMVVQRGVVGRAEAMRTIAPSTPKHACPGRATGGSRLGFVQRGRRSDC